MGEHSKDIKSTKKFELARKFPNNIDSYVGGKSSFLLAILRNHGFASGDLKEIERYNRNPENLSVKQFNWK